MGTSITNPANRMEIAAKGIQRSDSELITNFKSFLYAGDGREQVDNFTESHKLQRFPSGGIFAGMVLVMPFDVWGKPHSVISLTKRPAITWRYDLFIYEPCILIVVL